MALAQITAQDYYEQARVHKERAQAIRAEIEDLRQNAQAGGNGSSSSVYRANSSAQHLYYLEKQEWAKYEELMCQGNAVANAGKKLPKKDTKKNSKNK